MEKQEESASTSASGDVQRAGGARERGRSQRGGKAAAAVGGVRSAPHSVSEK